MMLCPCCARPLRAVERQGIELDHCTECGGFWLDQGELDRLVTGEATRALEAGQQALSDARRNREYDRAYSVDGFVALTPNANFGISRGAAAGSRER